MNRADANDFPRTMVGGVSLSRLIIGTNWFLGYSHTSLAKDNFIKSYQDPCEHRRHHHRLPSARR
jgi:hypothetical protein